MEYIRNKRIVFITTKNLDYIRNTQEIKLLNQNAKTVKIIGSNKKSYIKRIFEVYLKIMELKKSDFDAAFIGFAPQLVLPFWRRKFTHKLIIIDFFISMYDTFVCDRKIIKPQSLLARIMHKLDDITINNADYIISDTKAHARYFCEEFHASADKMDVLYLEADSKIYFPREQIKSKKYEGKFIVVYFGSILPLQGVDVIMQAMEELQNSPSIAFIIIGPISKKISKVDSSNIEYIDWLEQDILSDYIAMADLCLAGHFSAEVEKAKRTIPGKAYIYFAMKKRMILGDSPANHELFEENEYNHYVEMGNGHALAEKILELSNDANNKTV